MEAAADREDALAAVRQEGADLRFWPPELRSDREVVLEAVRQNGIALAYAAAELRADREVVMEAVQQNGGALEYAAAELLADSEVVLEAVRHDGSAMAYAALELRANGGRVIREAAASHLALAGSHAPVFTVQDVVVQESGTLQVVAHNLAGDSKTEVFLAHATLADVAGWLAEWHGRSRTVFVDFPGHGAPAPWDYNRTVVEWTGLVLPLGP
eukprot:CAMPEP_0203854306 /NCGR_PEP_ID=MMETSP0359-20131031/9027_1 /ASSEMBLY_ACC=CAM_ASM_000338 /TAXON_ID=268821 /ORGANISM="Scrippsiella Hangoei, Strain SHTV-5" /LENGTH=212 /DNA_ID=CAMNT_0050770775 /DNA_START=57 /DNA_END=692 /DNA_ORIENTATION=+